VARGRGRGLTGAPRPPRFSLRAGDPPRYFVGLPVPVVYDAAPPTGPPTLGVLVAVSDSLTGNGLFLDPMPWLLLALAVIVLGVSLWLPLTRSLTRPLARMSAATEAIAAGRFDERVGSRRGDEIGRLGRAIDHMAERLEGHVKGQQRFLRDIAHELASPVARVRVGLDLLEGHLDPPGQARLDDVREDAAQMATLVEELLQFARAEGRVARASLGPVAVAEVARQAREREARQGEDVRVEVPDDLLALAAPDLLGRALGNLIRNALVHAAGTPVTLRGCREEGQVLVEVLDGGPGVPEAAVERLFEPFYRPEAARTRATGGAGLGLAIVSASVSACGGTVAARNLEPVGFAVTIRLNEPEGRTT